MTFAKLGCNILKRHQCNSLFFSAVENENHVDIIICGGTSGLLLAHGLTKDIAFDHLNILLIEKDSKTQNDRTWCFLGRGLSEWEN